MGGLLRNTQHSGVVRAVTHSFVNLFEQFSREELIVATQRSVTQLLDEFQGNVLHHPQVAVAA
jgi:hypothetical protein